MTEFQPDEIVDITIKGVRVAYATAGGGVVILDEHGTRHLMPPQAAVTRVAPANWPPQPGDLWRRTDFIQPEPADDEPDLGLWFAHYDARLILLPAHGDIEYAETNPEKLRASGGRWTLVHREHQESGDEHV